MTATKLTYYISYGFLNGPANGKKMRQLLDKAGYSQASTPEKADILIGHSAGCWSFKSSLKPKLVIYVGLPLAAPTFKTSLQNNRSVLINFLKDRAFLQAARYYAIAGIYAVSQWQLNKAIIRNRATVVVQPFGKSRVIMVNNRFDPWPVALDLTCFIPEHSKWSFMSMPGSHDHIWQKPEQYVEIINGFAKQLA